MNILAIIPARGGSKGIPRKNVRLLNEKPLIAYAIENAKKCKLISTVVVSTDDQEIEMIASKYGATIIKRGEDLSGDFVTLDPVIHDATNKAEIMNNIKYDIVITLQATSPLLKSSTLEEAINSFIETNIDTYISVVNKPRLAWTKKEDKYLPLYEKRLNRQQLPPYYAETGAFVITKRQFVTPNSRFGTNLAVYEISEDESVDIDDYSDWMVCENMLQKKKIILRCDGHKTLGMGHIYHCLTLAYQLTGHDLLFVTNENYQDGLEKIKNSFFPYKTIKNDEDFYEILKIEQPDIVVNDCLDTTEEYIKELKKYSKKVVTIEDLGTGIKEADVVINALYEEHNMKNVYSGSKYVCLREEFVISNPIKVKENIENILVLFGGTDPSNFTRRIYDIALNYNNNIKFTFITGAGYDPTKNNIVTNKEKNIYVYNNVKNISEYMENSDLAFTSQGRTVYELASIGVPSIVLAQNERELKHTFANINNGFINLGLGTSVSDEKILETLDNLVNDFETRKEMNTKMLKNDIKKGIKREVNLILE